MSTTLPERSLKCLTVCQPWAWAIMHGPKRIENRTWQTTYRGPLLLHAGKSRARLSDFGAGEPPADSLTFGALLGLVDVTGCVPLAEVQGEPFADGPFCWLLANPRPFRTPIPCLGQLSLWTPSAALLAETHRQLEALPQT